MSIVIHNKIRGNGTIGGVIKMIIITLIFAPFHLDITGYCLMLGINQFHVDAKHALLFSNYILKPGFHLFFYIFFIPI